MIVGLKPTHPIARGFPYLRIHPEEASKTNKCLTLTENGSPFNYKADPFLGDNKMVAYTNANYCRLTIALIRYSISFANIASSLEA